MTAVISPGQSGCGVIKCSPGILRSETHSGESDKSPKSQQQSAVCAEQLITEYIQHNSKIHITKVVNSVIQQHNN